MLGLGLSLWDRAVRGGGAPLLDVFELARTRRVDIVGNGDSNQVKDGSGLDHGIPYALVQAGLRMYASGLVSANENGGSGAGVGYRFGRNNAGGARGATSGAPAELHKYLDPGSGGLFPANYGYLADGESVANNQVNGWIANADCPLDVTAALDFDFFAGTFAAGAGSWRLSVRTSAGEIAATATISTNTGVEGMRRSSLSIPANPARAGLNLEARWTRPGTNGLVGPWFGLWMRASNPAYQTGFSYHTLNFRGGQSARTMAVDLQEASDETLSYYFAEVRRLQGASKCVVIMVSSGLNDDNEILASVGPGAYPDGDSPEAYADNLAAITLRIQGIWTLNGWSQDELHFVFMPSHPVSTPDDPDLLAYRAEAKVYAATLDQGSVIDLDDRVGSAIILANGWYASAGADRNHLTQAGYEGVGRRAVRG